MIRLRLVLLLAVCAGACSRSHELAPCAEADAGAPVDATLLAFLSRARAAHHAADQAEAKQDLGGSIRELDEIVDGPLPAGNKSEAPEVREVLADTLARLADLESRAGDFAAAAKHLERGLALVPTPTYFRGHLFEVRGLAEERRAAALKGQGDLVHANEAEAASLEALEQAMKIQAAVIRDSVPTKP